MINCSAVRSSNGVKRHSPSLAPINKEKKISEKSESISPNKTITKDSSNTNDKADLNNPANSNKNIINDKNNNEKSKIDPKSSIEVKDKNNSANPIEKSIETDLKKPLTNENQQREKQKLSLKLRFADTTVIEENAEIKSSTLLSVQARFEAALEEFDKDNYEKACADAEFFTDTFAIGDSLKYEAMFLWSECKITKNDFDGSKEILIKLFEDENTPVNIFEKTLVRLGQVYCAENKEDDAKEMFARLKKDFPKSIYLKVANCNAVNQ